jgi:hypothetical protein
VLRFKDLKLIHKIAFVLSFALALCPVHLGVYLMLRETTKDQILAISDETLLSLKMGPWAILTHGLFNLILLPSIFLRKDRRLFIFQIVLALSISIADSISGLIYYFRFPQIGVYPTLLPVIISVGTLFVAILSWGHFFPRSNRR